MAEQTFDVVIAGAGPAGSTLAQRLAERGWRVALLEKKRFPRAKVCGEFLSPECQPFFAELGVLDTILARGARRVRGLELHGWKHSALGRYGPIGRSQPPALHGLALRREVLDAVLLDRALAVGGVTLFPETEMRYLIREDGAVRGVVARDADGDPVAIRARFTIGADGVRSRIAEELGVREPLAWLDKLALSVHLPDLAWGDVAEVHFFERGYFACAPVDGGRVCLNLVIDRADYRAAATRPNEFFQRSLEHAPALAERVRAPLAVARVTGLGPLACRTSRQTFDGAALVGDACGYVDPVTGEGVYFALVGARLLAGALDTALRAQRHDAEALAGYVAGRREHIAPRAAAARLLQRGLAHPRLARAVLATFAARPGLADLAVAVAGDYVPLSELFHPGVWSRALARRPASEPKA
ncbi:MAG: NAD(P)/FAD-dependent oxidoreductase [Planctomycetes bacterium]|nr:NAD(P)/FAD-dependent oxidoreductase [Planctomycetota bacterium]